MDTNEIRKAAAEARRWPHGCRLYSDAMTILFKAYRKANPELRNDFITLDAMWSWVNKITAEV